MRPHYFAEIPEREREPELEEERREAYLDAEDEEQRDDEFHDARADHQEMRLEPEVLRDGVRVRHDGRQDARALRHVEREIVVQEFRVERRVEQRGAEPDAQYQECVRLCLMRDARDAFRPTAGLRVPRARAVESVRADKQQYQYLAQIVRVGQHVPALEIDVRGEERERSERGRSHVYARYHEPAYYHQNSHYEGRVGPPIGRQGQFGPVGGLIPCSRQEGHPDRYAADMRRIGLHAVEDRLQRALERPDDGDAENDEYRQDADERPEHEVMHVGRYHAPPAEAGRCDVMLYFVVREHVHFMRGRGEREEEQGSGACGAAREREDMGTHTFIVSPARAKPAPRTVQNKTARRIPPRRSLAIPAQLPRSIRFPL